MSVVGFINGTIDTAQHIASHPMSRLLGLVFPQANTIIDFVERYGPVIDAAQPIIAKSVEAAEPVYEAVVKQLPKFSSLVADVIQKLPDSDLGNALSDMSAPVLVENLTRAIGGFGRMTPEEEKRWMDAATPGNDPSQENSKYTIG